ncbi:unnamed protein product [Adineta ricciae]|uniref:G-protein coupled receptors family 1 profile domain-containing protein n=1 Tax=Adineta ricciae TaxID=249248 RepID=A0A814NXS3_ADIRI|nr:unnamed protein product [Adineta ricciae]
MPSTESLIVANYSFTLIVIGTLFNAITFLILSRPRFRNTRARPTLHYMRTMIILDTFMLYGWNLDRYLKTIHGFYILRYSLASCKFVSFISYFAPQSSAWLRVFVCLDRYLSLSRLHRTWFSDSKHILMIIACILGVLFALNLHFFLFVCYYRQNGTISALSWLYDIYPLWDYVNLGVCNIVPFVLMVIFNSGVVYHLIILRRTTTLQNSHIQHRAISITLVITTFLFLAMTMPSGIAFAFFSDANATLLKFFDSFLYSYYILSFPLYMLTFPEFREECISIIALKRCDRRIQPQARVPLRTT